MPMISLRRALAHAVLAAFLALSWSTPAQAADKDMSPAERYELGLKQMNRGYYTKALEQFNRVRNYYRDDPVSVKAELAIADVYYKKHDFEQARLAYEDFSRLHPRHPDLDYVTWRIGLCLYQRAPKAAGRDQTATRQAVNVWASFQVRFPESAHHEEVVRLLARSRNRLAAKELFIARHYVRKDAWIAARGRAEGVISRYPTSDRTPEALTLAAKAYHAWGMVDEATALRDRLAADFPEDRYLHKLDRILSRPPGAPPEEEVFIRPYRMAGMGMTPGGM